MASHKLQRLRSNTGLMRGVHRGAIVIPTHGAAEAVTALVASSVTYKSLLQFQEFSTFAYVGHSWYTLHCLSTQEYFSTA